MPGPGDSVRERLLVHIAHLTRTQSPTDLLQQIVTAGADVTGADCGWLAYTEPENAEPHWLCAGPESLCLETAALEQAFPDILQRLVERSPEEPFTATAAGRAVLGVSIPLWNGWQAGLVVTAGCFSDEAPALLTRLAEIGGALVVDRLQASVSRRKFAETKACLWQAEQARREQSVLIHALHDTVLTINDTLNLDQVLSDLLENLDRVIPHAGANIMLYEPQARTARIVRMHGYDHPGWNAPNPNLEIAVDSRPTLLEIIQTQRPLLVPETSAYPQWVHWEGPEWLHSYLGAPMCTHDQVIGFINLDSDRPRAFTQLDAAVLEIFAEQAAIAVENARLYTQMEQAKDAAEAANRARSAFLANMSHDLRTPLNAINGFSQLMLKDASLSSEQMENLQMIRRGGEQLLRMINNLLEMANIEAGRLSVQPDVFDLHMFFDELYQLFQAPAARKQLALVFDLPEHLPQFVKCDEGKLRQICIHLLNHAVKMTSTGRVRLRAAMRPAQPGGTLLSVDLTDSGPGLTPVEQAQLFQPLTQARPAESYAESTRLGLVIALHYARLMGGSLAAASAGIGTGTTFTLTVPLEQPEGPLEPARKKYYPQTAAVIEPPCAPPTAAAPSAGAARGALPNGWAGQLRAATVRGDLKQILALAGSIQSVDPTLAQQLQAWAGQYAYDEILAVIQQYE